MNRVSRIYLPERQRNYRFALTPLADAMFQLLIFFMLSSSLTPYSLLTVQSAPGDAGAEQAAAGPASDDPPQQMSAPPADVTLWTLEADTVIVGGQRFDFDALDALADALGTAGAPADVILIVRPSAQVQDVTTVLARLRAAEVASVQVTTGAM
jgi:biopolymer transport protein ExbD